MTTAPSGITARVLAALLAGPVTLGLLLMFSTASRAAALNPAAEDAPPVVAAAPVTQDQASAAGPHAEATIVNGIQVTQHGGKPVTVSSKGQPTVTQRAKPVAPLRFTGLVPGKAYTVRIGNVTRTVVPVTKVGDASGLVVTSSAPDRVELAWVHTQTPQNGGNAVSYAITATAPGQRTIEETVVGARSAVLTGLSPDALYTFTVTPRNSASIGKASRATMSRTLQQIHGTSTNQPPSPPTTPQAPSITVVVPPAGPSTPPGPGTQTIYICPTGYRDNGAECIRTQPYTYATQPYTYTTRAYTYHNETYQVNIGSCVVPMPDGGSAVYENCMETRTRSVKDPTPFGWIDTGNEWVKKDPTPSGWTDTGTGWAKKDPTPSGWMDDGTQWIQATSKIPKVVPI
jgi:hypothetical protein